VVKVVKETTMDYVMLNTDKWEHLGKKYRLISLEKREGSSATELVLEYEGVQSRHVVAYHQIEFMEEE
jgi:hypothetical protein